MGNAGNILSVLLLCGLLGLVGQGVRAIVGLKNAAALEQAGASGGQGFNAAYLFVSLVIGFIAGILAGIIVGLDQIDATKLTDIKLLLGIAGSGYAGADFIENAFGTVIPGLGSQPSTPPIQPAKPDQQTQSQTPQPQVVQTVASPPASEPGKGGFDDPAVPNKYPELPVLAYQKTSISVQELVRYLNASDASTNIRRAVYVLFCNESAHGNSGVNNNYGGLQADGGRWGNSFAPLLSGTCVVTDSGGSRRRFLCFASWQGCVDMLISLLKLRGLYVGGQTHFVTNVAIATAEDWALAYYREWVTGRSDAQMSSAARQNLLSLYQEAAGTLP
jgi:hypothetical protein